jgi:hypothetical protein
MENVLITLGDSFTWGQGLDYHLRKDKYPTSFKVMKDDNSYPFPHLVSSNVVEFDEFRKKNNFSNILNEKLGTSLVTNFENGGSNVRRINDLENLIKFFKIEPLMVPKYCVFQLTHSIRDFDEILINRGEGFLKILGDEYCNKIRNWANGAHVNSNEYDELYPELYLKTINLITDKFKQLEKEFSCKCIFFHGLGDVYLIKQFESELKLNPYYFELVFNDLTYMTLLDLSHKNKLTIKDVLGFFDDHPSLELHNWLSEELYKKLL